MIRIEKVSKTKKVIVIYKGGKPYQYIPYNSRNLKRIKTCQQIIKL